MFKSWIASLSLLALSRAVRPDGTGIPLPRFGSPFGEVAVAGTSTGAVGTPLAIAGAWHHVGVETQPDNRFAYFIDTDFVERGPVAAAWLTSVYERPYPGGAASTAYRVRVECVTGRWAYQHLSKTEKTYLDMGFDRVAPPGTPNERRAGRRDARVGGRPA